jgi:hypothetical protein
MSSTTPSPGAPDRLKAMLPTELQCAFDAGGFPDQPKSIARAVCREGAPALVVYWLFPDADSLAAGFNKPLRQDLAESFVACPGRGQSPQDWHSAANPQRSGKISCIVGHAGAGPKGGTYPSIHWTVDSQLLLGSVGGDKEHSLDQLNQWWTAHYQ